MYYQDDFSKVMYNETVFYEYLEEVEEISLGDFAKKDLYRLCPGRNERNAKRFAF